MAEQMKRPEWLDLHASHPNVEPDQSSEVDCLCWERDESSRWAKVLEGRIAEAIALGECQRPVETPKDIVEMVRILKRRA